MGSYMEVEQLPQLIENKDIDGIRQLMKDQNLSVVNGKIIANDKDKAEEMSEYFDTQQLVRKINLNAIYGSLTNSGSNFFDIRLGSSTTLGGRKTVSHMGSKINELLAGKYELGKMVTYGDSVDASSIIRTSKGNILISELYEKFSKNYINDGKEYVYPTDENILVTGYSNNVAIMSEINFIMRHKTNKEKWKIETDCGKKVIVTNDHSIMVERDGTLVEVKPSQINARPSTFCSSG